MGRRAMRRIERARWAGALMLASVWPGCNPASSPTNAKRNDLSKMQTATVTIDDHAFEVWIARTTEEQQLGLMQVTADEMTPLPNGTERGMLFVFENERPLQFWMYNVVIPLDIAFLRSDGQIVKTHTMAPLDTRQYSSVMPAQMALEVNAGVLHKLGITEGRVVQIPETVLKPIGP